MSKKKDTFIFKKAWAEAISKRSAAVQLEVFNAIVSYASDGIIPQMSEVAEAVFDYIKIDIDKNNAKYDEICKKRSEAGKRGMESRYKDKGNDNEEDNKDSEPQQDITNDNKQEQDITKLTNDNKCNKSYQTVTNVTEYDNDYDNNDYHILKKENTPKGVSKKEAELLPSLPSDIEEDLNKEGSVLFEEVEVEDEVGLIDKSLVVPSTHKPFTDYAGVREMFNSICVCLPKVNLMTQKRKDKVRLRLKEMGNELETLKAFLEKVASCSFLNGDNSRGWKADFDWLFSSEDKWISVMEGKYDNLVSSFEREKKSELQKNLEFMDSIGVKQENVIF